MIGSSWVATECPQTSGYSKIGVSGLGGACVFLSGLSPQGRAVPKPLCCDVLTVEGVYQNMGYTSVWEFFLVTTSGVECCWP